MNNDENMPDPEPNRCPECGGLRSIYADDCRCRETTWLTAPTRPGLWRVDDGTGAIGTVQVFRFGGSFVFVLENDKEVVRVSARRGWMWAEERASAPAPQRPPRFFTDCGALARLYATRHALATALRFLVNPRLRPEDIHAGMTCGGTMPAPTNDELLRLADALEGR
jgi:hypothetical protein